MRKLLKICALFFLTIISATGLHANAGIVTIDFDGLADNSVVGSSFSGLGVTFVDARVFQFPEPGISPPNTIVHTSSGSGPQASDPIEALFSTTISRVSLTGIDVGANGFRLSAFDSTSGGNLLEEMEIFGSTINGAGEFFTLTIINPFIRRVEFSLAASGAVDGLSFDNLVFEGENISAVPVPAALPLLGSGLAIMGFLGWRRKRHGAAAG